jgi:hypothetical protein
VANHAIVVGIDAYEQADWKLNAAVADAVRFARWALDAGGVPAENLDLLLSAEPGTTVDLPSKPATRGNIEEAVTSFLGGRGAGDERLFVYCAGHGVSGPGIEAGGVQQPVLIPVDVTSLEQRSYLLLGFSDIIPRLLDAGPREQFFFIDTCRDFALGREFTQGVGSFSARWRPPNPEPGARRSQFVLYATAPGLQSYEKKVAGRGVFAGALIDALSGKRPAATRYAGGRWQVTFDSLFEDVCREVKRELELTKVRGAERYVQTPQREVLGETTDAVLASFDQVPEIPVSVKVTPRDAWTTGSVRVLYPTPFGDQEARTLGPPVKSICRFQVPPGAYVIAAKADTFSERRLPATISEPVTLPLVLEPAEQPAIWNERSSLQSASVASLRVESDDPSATIVVLDAAGQVVLRQTGTIPDTPLAPGIYRAQLLVPEGVADEETVEVRNAQATRVKLSPEPRDIGPGATEALEAIGIDATTGYVHPAEDLGFVASPSLASLLGFAAFASHWPDATMFVRLRKVGVHSFRDLESDQAAVLLLVGSSGDDPAAFLAGTELVVRDRHGAVVRRCPVAPLPGLAAAGQGDALVAPGPAVIEVSVPGAAPTRYAVTALKGRITTLVLVADDIGRFEVHQYLIPANPFAFPHDALSPDEIRAIDLGQRCYTEGKPLPPAHQDLLLDGKWLDPLLACIAGYSLVAAGDISRYAGHADPAAAGSDDPEPSAMRNMLRFFDQLPDSHVLAGLCEPDHRERHFANALDRGLPVFADGMRALHKWYSARGDVPQLLVEPARRALPGSPWTAWAVSRPALLVRDGHFDEPPVGWGSLTRRHEAIETALRGTGKVHANRGMQTGVVVGERLVLTFFYGTSLVGHPEPSFIDFADEAGRPPEEVDRWRFDIVRELRTDAKTMLALVEIAPRSRGGEEPPAPLTVARDRPSPLEACEVFIVGHPHDVGQAAPVLGEHSGVKRLQPGTVLGFAEEEGNVRHDCFTRAGDAGAALVHLESGTVLGLHHSGSIQDGGDKEGQARALWLLRKRVFFKGSAVNFG